ncbi:MAG: Gmad2 immunoglobulin-like domain-containing protein [bacterium]|nr:Gmad2 immunoglobulin-like domain-containing protein [bacterium]
MNKKYFMPFLALSALILIVGCIQNLSRSSSQIITQNIKVTNLKPNQEVVFPFMISGEVKVFENQFNYRIKDSKGILLKEGTILAKNNKFEVKITTLKTKDTKIVVEVFDESAKDGSEIDKVIIPLQI